MKSACPATAIVVFHVPKIPWEDRVPTTLSEISFCQLLSAK